MPILFRYLKYTKYNAVSIRDIVQFKNNKKKDKDNMEFQSAAENY